jgi:hypothetical protein
MTTSCFGEIAGIMGPVRWRLWVSRFGLPETVVTLPVKPHKNEIDGSRSTAAETSKKNPQTQPAYPEGEQMTVNS